MAAGIILVMSALLVVVWRAINAYPSAVVALGDDAGEPKRARRLIWPT